MKALELYCMEIFHFNADGQFRSVHRLVECNAIAKEAIFVAIAIAHFDIYIAFVKNNAVARISDNFAVNLEPNVFCFFSFHNFSFF